MAGSSLLTLIDDIASLLDDIAALTKAATGKTVGVLGDDLALNAEQVSGVRAERELPVVWAVAKGSAFNKVILVPGALALSYFLPWLVTLLLMCGGAYLCFEGAEKLAHRFLEPPNQERHQARLGAVADARIDLALLEREKIRGAIRTDFVLSGEIIVIALGSVQHAPFLYRALSVSLVAAIVTVGVYALVAGIVKIDDLGLSLSRAGGETFLGVAKRASGRGLLWFAPRFMRTLSAVGTVAMFLVGGGILIHGISPLGRWVHGATHVAEQFPSLGSMVGALVPTLLSGGVGLLAGVMLLSGHLLFRRVQALVSS